MKKNIFLRVKRFGFIETMRQILRLIGYLSDVYIFKKRFSVRLIHNYKMILPYGVTGLPRSLVVSGTREEQLKVLLDLEVQEGDSILDLGANIGYYSLMLAKLVGNSGKVIAYEPDNGNYNALLANIGFNEMSNIIEPHNAAIGNITGKIKFYLSEYGNMHSCIKAPFPSARKEFEYVDSVNINEAIKSSGSIKLIRMDIEGFEVVVLTELIKSIKTGIFSGDLVFEVHRDKYNTDNSLVSVLRALNTIGYKPLYVTSGDERKGYIRSLNYKPIKSVHTSLNRVRGIYKNIKMEDLVNLLESTGGVRDIYLRKGVL